jgi:hypothetical protein
MATFSLHDLSLPPSGGTYEWDPAQRLPSLGRGVVAVEIATRPDLSIALGPETPREAKGCRASPLGFAGFFLFFSFLQICRTKRLHLRMCR